METTVLTIHLPKEVSVALEKRARSGGTAPAELAADFVAKQLDVVKKPPAKESFKGAASIVDKTFGSSGSIKKQELISLAEDEEFGGY